MVDIEAEVPADETTRDRAARLGLAALLGTMTLLHVGQRKAFEAMIPRWLPGSPVGWNAVATAAEGTSAALLTRRATAGVGGRLAAATFVGVYVANVEAARLGGYKRFPGWFGTRGAAIVRLPLQVPLVMWAWRVARAEPGRGDGRRTDQS